MKTPNSNPLPPIQKTLLLDYPIQKVWKTVATSDGIALWFAKNNFQPIEEHEFYMDMREPQGKTDCKVSIVRSPHYLMYKIGKEWEWAFELQDQGEKTKFTFIWSGWDANKTTHFGMSHKKIHAQLIDGTKVLMKRLSRSIRKI